MTDTVMSEQTALVARRTGDPVWLDRLIEDDPLARLAETFLINTQVSPTVTASAALIHPQARDRTGEWLRGTVVTADAGSLRASPVPDDPGPLDDAQLRAITGLDSARLPRAYADWRLCIEVYVVVGPDVYLLLDHLAMPFRRLDEEALGMLNSARLLPFAAADEPTGVGVVLVGVPARLGALGGLRGFRTCLVEGGRAGAALAALATPAPGLRWDWHTEFFDDACAQILGVDGLERIPLLVGRLVEESS